MTTIDERDPRIVAVVEAIHDGDIVRLRTSLAEHPELISCQIGGTDEDGEDCGMRRSLMHVVTDWPGHFPNGAETVRVLAAAGVDVNGRFVGGHTETPLHWAASSDDIAVLDALVAAGADIEATGAVIADGTPISDASAFGQWNAARRLLELGATTRFWESATLGLLDRVEAEMNSDEPPDAENVTSAFWGACHGGQLATAKYLAEHGADLNWVGWDDLTPLDAARRSEFNDVADWLVSQGATSAGGAS